MTLETENLPSESSSGIQQHVRTAEETMQTTPHQSADLPSEIRQIFEFLSLNNRIVFKSQQIDDPELQRSEKVNIAREIYNKNRETFLLRFGSYMQETHLSDYARLVISVNASPALRIDENAEEMQLMIQDFRKKLKTRKRDVKNRRYAAMQNLIKQGEYFSEHEMMRREPELYQELIGQYLSEAEKKQRDSYDVRNTTFSGILMHTMQQQTMKDVLQKADEQINTANDITDESATDQLNIFDSKAPCFQLSVETHKKCNDSDDDSNEYSASSAKFQEEVDVPAACRLQWGNFDNEVIECTKSVETKTIQKHKTVDTVIKNSFKRNISRKFITAGERDLLRQEFLQLMHEQFLDGKDKEFNYTEVDENSQMDDLKQLNQDKENEYFEESDDDEDNVNEMAESIKENEESEDELDIYMSHLNKHHSLQN